MKCMITTNDKKSQRHLKLYLKEYIDPENKRGKRVIRASWLDAQPLAMLTKL